MVLYTVPLSYVWILQGKVQLEIRFDEYLNTELDFISSHRMAVKWVCSVCFYVSRQYKD